MNIRHSLEELRELKQPTSWALGFFDGFHLGHQAVLQAAKAMGGRCGLISFQDHPLRLLCPKKAPQLLTPSSAQKAALAQNLGVEELLLLPFNEELAALSPRAFLDSLRTHAPLAGLAIGNNCRFGQGGKGDAHLLQEYAKQHSIPYHIAAMRQVQDERICSTRIRQCLAAGKMALVNTMLGRPFSIYGQVEHGQQLARQLGFRTANIHLASTAALPPFGVYTIQCQHKGQTLQGIANLGLRPSIQEEGKIVRLEAHLFDWSGDLYGQNLEVQLLDHLRGEQQFSGIPALQEAIAKDVQAAQLLLAAPKC